jgi:hypothetical protein
MADDLTPREQQLFADIAQILQSARAKAYRAVNTAMVETTIGKWGDACSMS